MNICPAFLLWHAIVSWQIFKVICRLPFFCFFIQMAISFSSQCRWAVLIAHYLMQNVNWWIANVLFGEELACFWSSRSCSCFFLSFWKKKNVCQKHSKDSWGWGPGQGNGRASFTLFWVQSSLCDLNYLLSAWFNLPFVVPNLYQNNCKCNFTFNP